MTEENVYVNHQFPIVLLTKEDRKTMAFWCPKSLALIEQSNRLALIALWNKKPGQHIMTCGMWFQTLERNATAAA